MNGRSKHPVALVTGGAGFIGSAVSRRLLSEGVRVHLVDPRSPPLEPVEALVTIRGRVDDVKTLEQIHEAIDVVFHFGAPSSMEMFRDDLVGSSINSMAGFLNVLEFARTHGVERVVYASSGTVYGATAGAAEKRLEPLNIYGAVKLAQETIASEYSDSLRATGLRIFMGYGPGEESKGDIGSPAFLFLREMLRGNPPVVWGDGSQTRDLVYIDDIVEAAVRVAELDRPPRVLDIGTGVPTSFQGVVATLAERLGRPTAPIYVPIPRAYQASTRADPTLLKQLLGRDPTPASVGLDRFCTYLAGSSHPRV